MQGSSNNKIWGSWCRELLIRKPIFAVRFAIGQQFLELAHNFVIVEKIKQNLFLRVCCEFRTQTMIFDQKRFDGVMRQIYRWKQLVSSSIGHWVIKAQSIEAEKEKKITGKITVHSKTVALINIVNILSMLMLIYGRFYNEYSNNNFFCLAFLLYNNILERSLLCFPGLYCSVNLGVFERSFESKKVIIKWLSRDGWLSRSYNPGFVWSDMVMKYRGMRFYVECFVIFFVDIYIISMFFVKW